MFKVVVAPDSLKGSVSATNAANAICDGIRRARPALDVAAVPISDGGEGFLDAFASVDSGPNLSREVEGPDGQPVTATYRLRDRVAVIELAQAAGLHLSERYDITTATTFGVGELLLDAVKNGAREVLVGLGGSATVDGGIGLLRALGARFIDDEGRAITTPAGLARLGSVLLPTLESGSNQDVRLRVAVDVEQKLAGCATTFGSQKGGTPHDVEVMELALQRFAAVADGAGLHANKLGSGAAGGVGFALSLLGAELQSGIDLVLDAVGFDEILVGASLCVTAEGRVDAQSFQGKATVGVARRAAAAGVRCLVIAGSIADDVDTTALPFEVVPLHPHRVPSPEQAKASVIEDLRRVGGRIARSVDSI